MFKGSRPEVFCKKSHIFIKKETLIQALPWEFCEISKNNFLTEHLWAIASAIAFFVLFDQIWEIRILCTSLQRKESS